MRFIQNIRYSSLFVISCLLMAIPVYSQSNQIPLKEFLFKIGKEYNVSILYESDLTKGIFVSNTKKYKGDVETIIQGVITPYGLILKKIEEGTYIILKKNKNEMLGSEQQKRINGNVWGKVIDETGGRMQGVNISLIGTTMGTFTNSEGEFKLENIKPGKYTLEVSFIGYIKDTFDFNVTYRRRNHSNNFKLALDLLSLKTVIITGVNQPIRNLESGVAVTTISQEELNKISPRSTADAFQNIPGFYVEASAGEVSNNLFSRGMPSEGNYKYVALHEDGLPVYEAGDLEWVSADHFVRIDGTIQSLEGMRGGAASIFAGNAPGGIINFISKTGGSKVSGQFKLQTADFGQLRMEGNVGGPIKKTFRYHIGGYYRIDNGIRQPGFIANKGGQIKGNITKVFNKGYIRVSGKYLNDRNIYYLPIPLQNTQTPRAIENFDPNYGTLASDRIRQVAFPTPYGEKEFDLADGMHTHLGYIGTHVKFDIGNGWQMINKNRFSIIDKGSNAIVSIFTPRTANDFLSKYKGIPSTYIPKITYTNTGESFDFFNANNNGLVVEAGWWATQNILQNFINSFELSKKTKKYEVSSNLYLSSFSNKTNRDWGSILLEVMSDNPNALDVAFLTPNGAIAEEITHNGFTTYQSLDTYLNSNGNAYVFASFVHGKAYLSNTTSVDGGVRFESLFANGIRENTQVFDLNPEVSENENLVLQAVRYGDSTFTAYSINKNALAWTIGFNHSFTQNSSSYVRVSDGFRMPDFDNWQNRQLDGGLIERVFQTELGYKYTSKKYAFLFTGFYSYISNQVTVEASLDSDDNLIPARTRDGLSYGGEFETVAKIVKGFSVNLTATLQNATYIVKAEEEFDPNYRVNGNEVKRIPNLYFVFRPTYEFMGVKIFGTASYIGERFSDEINIDILPRFMSFNAGVSYKYKSYSFLIHAQNVTNSIGLTEGNPRVIENTTGNELRMARPILGRSVIAFVAYQF